MSFAISALKRDSVRLYYQLFVDGCMPYLRYLCLFVHSGVQHIVCCGFVLFFFVLLSVSLFGPILRYSLTFIRDTVPPLQPSSAGKNVD